MNGHTERVNSVAFSPDDSHLVSASDDNTVCLWSTEDYTLQKRFTGHQGRVRYAATGSDGKYVVSYSNDDWSIIVCSEDDVVNCREEYYKEYGQLTIFPGGHRLTEEVIREYLLRHIERHRRWMIDRSQIITSYFIH